MRYVHYGKDYTQLIEQIPDKELALLKIDSEEFKVPFNPAVKPDASNIKIAFFGINAHANAEGFGAIKKYKNFLVEIQEREYGRLFRVIEMYRNGIDQAYFDSGSIYYSNFVKIVLRDDYFMGQRDVSRMLYKCPETLRLNKNAAKIEIDSLKEQGCKLFVAFGQVAHHFLNDINQETPFVLEKHFSWAAWESKYVEKTMEELNAEKPWND